MASIKIKTFDFFNLLLIIWGLKSIPITFVTKIVEKRNIYISKSSFFVQIKKFRKEQKKRKKGILLSHRNNSSKVQNAKKSTDSSSIENDNFNKLREWVLFCNKMFFLENTSYLERAYKKNIILFSINKKIFVDVYLSLTSVQKLHFFLVLSYFVKETYLDQYFLESFDEHDVYQNTRCFLAEIFSDLLENGTLDTAFSSLEAENNYQILNVYNKSEMDTYIPSLKNIVIPAILDLTFFFSNGSTERTKFLNFLILQAIKNFDIFFILNAYFRRFLKNEKDTLKKTIFNESSYALDLHKELILFTKNVYKEFYASKLDNFFIDVWLFKMSTKKEQSKQLLNLLSITTPKDMISRHNKLLLFFDIVILLFIASIPFLINFFLVLKNDGMAAASMFMNNPELNNSGIFLENSFLFSSSFLFLRRKKKTFQLKLNAKRKQNDVDAYNENRHLFSLEPAESVYSKTLYEKLTKGIQQDRSENPPAYLKILEDCLAQVKLNKIAFPVYIPIGETVQGKSEPYMKKPAVKASTAEQESTVKAPIATKKSSTGKAPIAAEQESTEKAPIAAEQESIAFDKAISVVNEKLVSKAKTSFIFDKNTAKELNDNRFSFSIVDFTKSDVLTAEEALILDGIMEGAKTAEDYANFIEKKDQLYSLTFFPLEKGDKSCSAIEHFKLGKITPLEIFAIEMRSLLIDCLESENNFLESENNFSKELWQLIEVELNKSSTRKAFANYNKSEAKLQQILPLRRLLFLNLLKTMVPTKTGKLTIIGSIYRYETRSDVFLFYNVFRNIFKFTEVDGKPCLPEILDKLYKVCLYRLSYKYSTYQEFKKFPKVNDLALMLPFEQANKLSWTNDSVFEYQPVCNLEACHPTPNVQRTALGHITDNRCKCILLPKLLNQPVDKAVYEFPSFLTQQSLTPGKNIFIYENETTSNTPWNNLFNYIKFNILKQIDLVNTLWSIRQTWFQLKKERTNKKNKQKLTLTELKELEKYLENSYKQNLDETEFETLNNLREKETLISESFSHCLTQYVLIKYEMLVKNFFSIEQDERGSLVSRQWKELNRVSREIDILPYSLPVSLLHFVLYKRYFHALTVDFNEKDGLDALVSNQLYFHFTQFMEKVLFKYNLFKAEDDPIFATWSTYKKTANIEYSKTQRIEFLERYVDKNLLTALGLRFNYLHSTYIMFFWYVFCQELKQKNIEKLPSNKNEIEQYLISYTQFFNNKQKPTAKSQLLDRCKSEVLLVQYETLISYFLGKVGTLPDTLETQINAYLSYDQKKVAFYINYLHELAGVFSKAYLDELNNSLSFELEHIIEIIIRYQQMQENFVAAPPSATLKKRSYKKVLDFLDLDLKNELNNYQRIFEELELDLHEIVLEHKADSLLDPFVMFQIHPLIFNFYEDNSLLTFTKGQIRGYIADSTTNLFAEQELAKMESQEIQLN
uniref:Orf1432 n=1 Tax=Schizomeris leibleinii TaxID=104533 RepID=F8SY98_9CHLO|nr:orf1432 [Schizomeris leibleinii]AEH05414.1 orf1432 [Schizomeris leibleinii]